MKPLLYLDVDGVLNVEPFQGQFLDGLPACPAPFLETKLGALQAHFEVVWATAWLGRAHSAWFRVCGFPPEPFRHVEYRMNKVTEILKDANGRPWAWVDDDASFEFDTLGWKPPERFLPDNCLVVEPLPSTGLTWPHVSRLVNFAGGLTSQD